jgi:hypothetical protein
VVELPTGFTVLESQFTPLVIAHVPVPTMFGPFVAPWTVAMKVMVEPSVAVLDSPFASETEMFVLALSTKVEVAEAVPSTAL